MSSFNSSLIFSNSSQIDLPLVDFYYLYIHPFMFLLAFIANTLCAIVLGHSDFSSTTSSSGGSGGGGGVLFRYLFFYSLNTMASALLVTGLTPVRCGKLCSTSTTYFAQAYEFYVIYILTQILYLFNSFLQATISVQTYLSLIFRHKKLNALISSPKFLATVLLFFAGLIGPINYLNYSIM
jgi:hypothetical protein